jgi:1-aminocyclopropane-1-carboxylate deaminase/D-cysteine desulfhydrase-like pyridoxal-dependent ACC family enzyme
MSAATIAAGLAGVPRVRLATLPTPLEAGPRLPGGAQLLVKRDDLTGLGMGGNKARKLELLCGAARERGADVLVTVGAEQSNHARMSAAAGAVLGLDTHLVLGGDPEAPATGNRLLAELFGATVHQPGSDDWAVLSTELERVTARLRGEGRRPYAFPLGGSTATGALGFLLAWAELMEQCDSRDVRPSAIVHASSTGGTHGGLLAGRAAYAAAGAPVPDVVAIGVAKEPGRDLAADARRLAEECITSVGLPGAGLDAPAELDERWIGPGYGVPSDAGDAAIVWAARHGGWVLDRTYSGKALGGLLGRAREGRYGPGDAIVFWHTGGHPAVFAPDGAPDLRTHGSAW